MEQTSEKQTTTPLTLEQRIEAIEARQHAIAIAFTIALEELAKIDDAELSQDQRPWDPTKINWIDKVGNKGPYQQSNDANNPEWQLMSADLDKHNGKLRRQGYFYWRFTQSNVVGRKLVAK